MRSVEEIYKDLLSAFARRAGFTPEAGCDLAVRLWAAAAQMQALEIQADWVLDQSFPQTAQGVYLDRHGAMRGLKRLGATRSGGTLRFSVGAPPVMDVTIPAGTVCMTAEEVRVRTSEEAVIPAGALYADAPAEAVEAGTGGNVVPGAVRFLTACPVAVTSVTNPEAFTGGCEEEDDETFRARILESYRRLPNGANTAWYETTAMGYPGVTAAKAVGRAEGPGTVNVYVTGENGLPDGELLAGLQAELQEKRRIRQEKAEFKNHLRQAEKGDAYAQSKTAELYLVGIGVKQDIQKGIEWYEKASETDEGYAARQLAKLYSEGEFVPVDPEKAAYWRMVGGVLDEL